jgi:DNA-binding NarL/FixJ family response regulator
VTRATRAERDSTSGPACSRPIAVLVVDDSPIFRRGMARAVEAHPGLELVGEAEGGEAGLEAIARLEPDVVLLDLVMPDLDGLQVLARLRDREPRTTASVVVVSASLDAEVERQALLAGAVACASKALSCGAICAKALRAAQ